MFITCTLKIDRMGFLHVWEGDVNPAVMPVNSGAFIQREEDIEATLEYTDMTMEDRESLEHGWPVTCGMYDECLCVLFDIEF